MLGTLMSTFSAAERSAATAARAATPASDTTFLLPFSAATSDSAITSAQARAQASGASVAFFRPSWIAAERAAFCSSVSFGRP